MPALYYWKKYHEDTCKGPIFKLNQNAPMMRDVSVCESIWAIASDGPGRYVLAAEFRVARTGVNRVGDPDLEQYGLYFFEADPTATRYFDIKTQASIEPIIRGLSI